MSACDADVLVIGGGPAGSSTAIRLARGGWNVALIERSTFPRHKVCGECLGPAGLYLLSELGLADRVLESAGPEIRRVGWMSGGWTVTAAMPPCESGPYRYGRAIGRDVLDLLLLERAAELGVRIIQPARARRVVGGPGAFVCEYRRILQTRRAGVRDETLSASLVVDAHGSWECAPAGTSAQGESCRPPSSRDADLLGFKAIFRDTGLPAGLLPILSLPGGYGGMIVTDRGRTTIACCIRRDVVREYRVRAGCDSAAAAAQLLLRGSCRGAAMALEGARLQAGWLCVGPLRPGFHATGAGGALPVGNAIAEAHPLIGEGICMALESAALLAAFLGERRPHLDRRRLQALRAAYVAAARAAFGRRLRLARLYAYAAMRRPMGATLSMMVRRWPRTLSWAARLAEKAHPGMTPDRMLTRGGPRGSSR
jgi:menaquinone-9 beta-reductase